MSGNSMSLKAKIRNLARKKDMSAQVVLQNYMFERFLDRLSKSEYRNNFILKGGMLIASLVGIDNRATMDMDATVKDYPISAESLSKAIMDISSIHINDDITFTLTGIDAIREDDAYGGFRVSVVAKYDTIITPMQIDITTGDVITPKEVQFLYKTIFENNEISIWAYNIETVLAEKVETVLKRGELNTRPRDFYDIYILTKTQTFEPIVFANALRLTAEHRESTHILNQISKRINEITESETLRKRWIKYTKDYRYAAEINYEDVIIALSKLTHSFSVS